MRQTIIIIFQIQLISYTEENCAFVVSWAALRTRYPPTKKILHNNNINRRRIVPTALINPIGHNTQNHETAQRTHFLPAVRVGFHVRVVRVVGKCGVGQTQSRRRRCCINLEYQMRGRERNGWKWRTAWNRQIYKSNGEAGTHIPSPPSKRSTREQDSVWKIGKSHDPFVKRRANKTLSALS